MSIKITTIWWWNGQSIILSAFNKYLPQEFEISSIVSMSDDWRTTWRLIRDFDNSFWIHLPPPWDLRRCFYTSSKSKYIYFFKHLLENIFVSNKNISDLTIKDLLYLSISDVLKNIQNENIKETDLKFLKNIKNEIKLYLNNNSWELYNFFYEKLWEYINIRLNISKPIKWYKFWNILMASIYHNLWDYNKMLEIMHNFLEVKYKIIPVTIKKAFIKANLENWDIIETQDNISNNINYSSKISSIELMRCSRNAIHHEDVDSTIINADYIIITPWDLFTSIIANFIIGWVKNSIQKSNAKIILIWNNTNKWWEAFNLKIIDFIENIERYLWKRIDFFITNNKKITLDQSELDRFKNDISVKWWDFLYLEKEEIKKLKNRWTKIITWDLLDKKVFYKHNKKEIAKIIYGLIK